MTRRFLHENIIAIIDDGISKSVVDDLCFSLTVKNNKIIQNKEPIDISSHGSICAAIIRKYAPYSQLGSIKVLHSKSLKGNRDNLIQAISWCVANGIRIVNLSIGSVLPQDYFPLLSVINTAAKYGTIIIAAESNDRKITYPACFSNTIGVVTNPLQKNAEFEYLPALGRGIDFSASSTHLLDMPHGKVHTPNCNSYAAPVITALISNFSESLHFDSIFDVKSMLIENQSSYSYTFDNVLYCLDWLNEIPQICYFTTKEGNKNIGLKNNVKSFEYDSSSFVNNWVSYLDNYSAEQTALGLLFDSNNELYANYSWLFSTLHERSIIPLLLNDPQTDIFLDKPVFLPRILQHYESRQKKDDISEIPIILIDQSISGIFVTDLVKCFFNTGYRALCFSDEVINQLYGHIYWDDRVSFNSCLKLVSDFECDIIIVHKHIEQYKSIVKPDLIITDKKCLKNSDEDCIIQYCDCEKQLCNTIINSLTEMR
ncbi:S8 family serine peptidase [Eubacteriales bacterium OttesenSCG-928-N14]|nr:S8 family serine peptidase [Eubacteriales bacterium OttesenSCG-928-N14]